MAVLNEHKLIQLLIRLKEDHMAWRAVVLTWVGLVPPAWQQEGGNIPTIVRHMFERAVEEMDDDKFYLFYSSSGSVVLIAKGITQEQVDTAKNALEETISQMDEETAVHSVVMTYDFSIPQMWDEFVPLCKWMHGRSNAAVPKKDKQTILSLLNKQLVNKGAYLTNSRKQHKQPVVLFVEDDPATRALIHHVLGREKIELVFADTGAAAIEKFLSHAPHMLFMDIEMPMIDGFEALSLIRKVDKKTPVIMLTAKSSLSNIEQAKELNVQGFITKPFTAKKLKDFLNKHLITYFSSLHLT